MFAPSHCGAITHTCSSSLTNARTSGTGSCSLALLSTCGQHDSNSGCRLSSACSDNSTAATDGDNCSLGVVVDERYVRKSSTANGLLLLSRLLFAYSDANRARGKS